MKEVITWIASNWLAVLGVVIGIAGTAYAVLTKRATAGSMHSAIEESAVFDILSSAWVLACNDESEIMTYQGICYRLNLPEDGLQEVKRIIGSRGELFRKGVPSGRLDLWKQSLRDKEGKRPLWILEGTGAQDKAIEGIGTHDVFRSQFRAKRDSPKSSIETIEWGLRHIDRLRKASLESREYAVKKWQVWSVLVLGVLNVVVAAYVASFAKAK